jgi:succinate dehydrogenase/fumarate reductase-like Fe-S protein
VSDRVRQLTFEIFRFNPKDPDSTPHMQTCEIEEVPYMSLFMALNEIRETLDPTLQFDFVCRSAICGACGMMACHDICPKELPLLEVYAYLRRKALTTAL